VIHDQGSLMLVVLVVVTGERHGVLVVSVLVAVMVMLSIVVVMIIIND
jgi:hypothetical protein